jgi:hypothetical protein
VLNIEDVVMMHKDSERATLANEYGIDEKDVSADPHRAVVTAARKGVLARRLAAAHARGRGRRELSPTKAALSGAAAAR